MNLMGGKENISFLVWSWQSWLQRCQQILANLKIINHLDWVINRNNTSVVQVHTLQTLAQSSVHTDENEVVQVHSSQFTILNQVVPKNELVHVHLFF